MTPFAQKTTKQKDPTALIMAAGFAVTLFLMLVLIVVGLKAMLDMKNNIGQLVNDNNVKVQLANTMRDTIRQRGYILLNLSIIEDDFDKDEELQNFHHFVGLYSTAREQLLGMQLDTQEDAILKRLEELTASAMPINNRAAELTQWGAEDEMNEALHAALEGRIGLLQQLDALVKLEHDYALEAQSIADQQYAQATLQMAVLTLLFLVIGGSVSWWITRIASKRNRELDARNQELNNTLGELQEAQQQLVQSEKMSSLGQMVAGVAHEVNNPANFIAGGAGNSERDLTGLQNYLFELMGEEEKESPVGQEITQRFKGLLDMNQAIRNGVTRIQDVVKNLRTFSRLDEAAQKDADIHECIDSTLEIVSYNFKNDVNVVKDYGELPRITCNPSQLNQVFMNLLTNAGQAIDKSGTISIITGFNPIDRLVWIKIADDGCGIEADKLQKIFEPFYTTKPVGEGTGLGLSISYSIIQKHHGEIEVDSTPGVGTRFTLALPVDGQAVSEVDD